MKQLFILLIGLLPVSAIAQSKVTIDLITGIDYSYRILNDKNSISYDGYTFRMLNARNYTIKSASAAYRDSIEKPDVGFRGGININFKISRYLFFKSGLRYVSNGYKSVKIYDPSLSYEAQYKASIRFIEVPTGVRYVFLRRKIACFAELGLTTTYALNYKLKTITELDTKNEVLKNADMLDIHFNGFGALGLQTDLNEEMMIFVQPIFRYDFTLLSNAPVREHLYSAGIECGLRFYFNKK